MNRISGWLVRSFCVAILSLLGVGGWIHFLDGLEIDRALPVPSYMLSGITLPKSTYRRAANALKSANAANGDAQIAGAEAAMNSGVAGLAEVPALDAALASAPALTRGWLLLAWAWAPTNHAKAAVALSQSLILAPYDYWVAGVRARVAALLWQNLDADAQTRALAQVRLLWEEPLLRPQLPVLLSSPGGPALVRHAFEGEPEQLAALNRFVSATHSQFQTSP